MSLVVSTVLHVVPQQQPSDGRAGDRADGDEALSNVRCLQRQKQIQSECEKWQHVEYATLFLNQVEVLKQHLDKFPPRVAQSVASQQNRKKEIHCSKKHVVVTTTTTTMQQQMYRATI